LPSAAVVEVGLRHWYEVAEKVREESSEEPEKVDHGSFLGRGV